eukprot:3560858-Pleurochrysis_carterae.AAC.1
MTDTHVDTGHDPRARGVNASTFAHARERAHARVARTHARGAHTRTARTCSARGADARRGHNAGTRTAPTPAAREGRGPNRVHAPPHRHTQARTRAGKARRAGNHARPECAGA